MAEVNLPVAILLGLAYALTLNLAKGVQKWGIEGLSLETLKQRRDNPELKKKFYFWAIGSAGTTVAATIQILAQPFAPSSSFVAAFGGVGLFALVIFSYYVLEERIKLPEIVGAVLVVAATVVFAFMAEDTSTMEVDYSRFALITLVPLGILVICAIVSAKRDYIGHAVIWGAMAGLFSGAGIALSQTAAIGGDRDIFAMLITLDFWLAVATGQGAFWGTQVGFKRGHATIVVTLYNVLMLLVPLVVDIFVLGQVLPPVQLGCLVVIAIGVVLLTAFRENPPAAVPVASLDTPTTTGNQD